MAKKSDKKPAAPAAPLAKGLQHLKGLTPNELADPQTPADVAALAVTCRFLGKTYYEGDLVCWQNVQWKCTAQGWDKTLQPC
jgi:hypothetical protein